MKLLLKVFVIALLVPSIGNACSMYKITKEGKTIVGNNEDWMSPNSQFWYQQGGDGAYGVMYMGLLNNFAQGAINEKGLMFDGFANPELAINDTAGKIRIPISEAIRHIMRTMSTAEEVESYLKTINLSSLTSSQIVFVDNSGTYLIVEGDELILGDEKEKSFSNFYYSQIESIKDVELNYFQKGVSFLDSSEGNSTLDYCSKAMESFSNDDLFGTQYSTIYDLDALKIRVYLFHDYSQFIEIDLKKELESENHSVMIADLFPKTSIGKQHYAKYNDIDNPTGFLEELVGDNKDLSESELLEMGFNSIINSVGYEWLRYTDQPTAAIKIFKYGISLMPNDANLYDSLGEAYFENKEWRPSIKNYGKSLALNPHNDNALEMLERIRAEME